MTTTHTPATGDVRPSFPMDELERRRRRDSLLNTREKLAILAAERHAHRVEDAWDITDQQFAVEAVIGQEFPQVYEEQLADWATLDSRLIHDPNRLSSDCGICQAIARRGGVNIEPPEAA